MMIITTPETDPTTAAVTLVADCCVTVVVVVLCIVASVVCPAWFVSSFLSVHRVKKGNGNVLLQKCEALQFIFKTSLYILVYNSFPQTSYSNTAMFLLQLHYPGPGNLNKDRYPLM